jgi:predicted transcriptional regulator
MPMRAGLAIRISNLFGIRGCGRRILAVLEERRDGLTLRELVRLTRRSERSVREHLRRLRELRLLKVIKVKTKRGRIAHLYVSPSPAEITESVKKLLEERIGGG